MLRAVEADPWDSIPSPEPLTHLFAARAARFPERPSSFSKVGDRWVPTSWHEAKVAVEETALGLLEFGVVRGDAVAILSHTRREWVLLDMAIMSIGAVTVGLYPSLPGADCRALLQHSGARVVVVDDRGQLTKIAEACRGLEPPVKIVTLESRVEGDDVTTLDDLRRRGARRRLARPDEFERRLAENRSSDVVSYIYTSGTTGEPKGVMLTHANFHYVIHATDLLIPYDGERTLVFLPLAHSLQRYASYLALIANVEPFFAESLEKVPENLKEVRPSCFAVVPRILEKVHARALAAGEGGSSVERRIFTRSLSALRRAGRLEREGRVPGLRDRLYRRGADRIVGARVRQRMGGRVKFIGSGGAPLSTEVHEFFEDIGIPILEGYGLTETSAPVCLSTLVHRRIGSVGRPLPGTQVRIAGDGEILVRGPGVFQGYLGNPAATREVLDEDGWFRTGDIGEMSRDGFLRITDRKKDLIITSGGKNVAPQPIESELRADPLVSQAVVIGDRRPYLTALLALDPAVLAELGTDTGSMAAEALPGALAARLDAHLARVNEHRAPFEQIKRYAILPTELTIEAGELTPTLKVRRRVVQERHGDRIETLYRGA